VALTAARAVGHVTGAESPAVCGASRVRPSPRAAPYLMPATPALRASGRRSLV